MDNYVYLLFPIYYLLLCAYLIDKIKRTKLDKTKDKSTQTDIV